MRPRIGESLKIVVSKADGPIGDGKPPVCLSEPSRLAVYSSLLELAIARAGTVAKFSGKSRKACTWHLKALTARGFAERWSLMGGVYYAPAGAAACADDALLLTAALAKPESKILLAALESPGVATAPFSLKALSRASKLGLVEVVRDGRGGRVYPGRMLISASANLARGYEAHKSHVFKLLHESGAHFDVSPLRGGAVEYKIAGIDGEISFAVPANPLVTALASRKTLYNIL